MSYKIETDVHFTFEDGKALIVLNGTTIDLMKYDTAQEYKVLLWGIASSAMGDMVTNPPTVTQEPVNTEPDLSNYADQIRDAFQQQADKAQERLHELTSLNESAVRAAQGQ